jgi:hypothetical protein
LRKAFGLRTDRGTAAIGLANRTFTRTTVTAAAVPDGRGRGTAARGRTDHAPHILVPPAVRRPARHRSRLGWEAWEARGTPAVFTVNTLVGENNGPGVGHVSLREATAEADAIQLSVTGTIQLGNPARPE